MSGRRAAFGVALKNAKRNKRRTFYLVLLIAVPVMVAVVTSTFVRLSHVTPEERATTEFGAGNVLIHESGSTPALAAWIDDTIAGIAPSAEILAYRADHTVFSDGEFGRVTDIDLGNRLSSGILTLVEGRAATGEEEVVLTEHLAEVLDAGMGDSVALGSGDDGYEVVGVASHPIFWNVNEAVLSPEGHDRYLERRHGSPLHVLMLSVEDDQAFNVAFWNAWERDRYDFYPQDRDWPMPERYWFLWEGDYAAMSESQLAEIDRIIEEEGADAAWSFANQQFPNGVAGELPEVYSEVLTDRLTWDRTNIAETGPVIGTGVAAVILAEVAFIAGAAFATGTRRRLREIGLMGANGASTSHVRVTVVGEGLVVGLSGGLLGSALAFFAITLGLSIVQQFVDRRIEGFPFSMLDIAGPMVVAIISCAIAAWVPARTAAGVPTLTALQGRMPVGAPRRWVIPVGIGMGAFGVLLLGVGLAGGNSGSGVVAVIGAVLMIGGAALLAGPMVASIAKHAERFPITPRIVLRDSGRQRGRAAAAVAATMVILMAPVSALATLEQSEANRAIDGLALDQPQVLISGTFSQDTGEVGPLADGVIDDVRSVVPDARLAMFQAIDVPIKYPAEVEVQSGVQDAGDAQLYPSPWRMSVANDELLAILDDDRLEEVLAGDGIALIGVEERESTIEVAGETVSVAEVPIAVQRWSFPRVIVTEERASSFADFENRDQLLVEVDQSWFDAMNPFQDRLQPLWEAGLALDMSGGGVDLSREMIFALVFLATMLVVLIVVATITALSAAEADSDLQTVVAVGATNSIRRRYLGIQSGIHTLLGCLLAVPLTLLLMRTVYSSNLGGYVQVGAFGVFDSSQLFVPWAGIAALVVGLPLMIGLVTSASVKSARTTPPRRAT